MCDDGGIRTQERWITERLVEMLREGVVPWVRPWDVSATLPVNRLTGRAYRGSNVLTLWVTQVTSGYGSHEWLTKKQATRLGGTIRPGERPAGMVRFFSPVVRVEEDDSGAVRRRPSYIARASAVYNLDQVAGVEPRPVPERSRLDVVQDVAAFISDVGADVRVGSHARYWVDQDFIEMPPSSAFHGAGEYASVSLHEHAHWTGPRLGRDLTGKKGTPAVALEELVAELTAAYLGAEYGLGGRLRHAGYLQAWIDVLEEEPRVLFKVAHQASRAAAFLRQEATENRRRSRAVR